MPFILGHPLYFINASIDSTCDSKERSKFKGLAQTLASVSFLKNLALMYDALEELKSTSEFLQLKNVTFAKAVYVISRLISIFEGRKFGGGPKVSEVKLAIESGIFQDVNISEGRNQLLINQATFYQQLVRSHT